MRQKQTYRFFFLVVRFKNTKWSDRPVESDRHTLDYASGKARFAVNIWWVIMRHMAAHDSKWAFECQNTRSSLALTAWIRVKASCLVRFSQSSIPEAEGPTQVILSAFPPSKMAPQNDRAFIGMFVRSLLLLKTGCGSPGSDKWAAWTEGSSRRERMNRGGNLCLIKD